MAQPAETIRCLLLPVGELQVLLPGATVAEVAAWQAPQPVEGAPAWLLGRVEWRGATVPVTDLEALVHGKEPAPVGRRARLAVLHSLAEDDLLPFHALVLRQVPHMVHVFPGLVTPEARVGGLAHGVVAQTVSVHGEHAVIPDLDVLERTVRGALGLGG